MKWANKKSHQRNKKYHDRRAKHREFVVGDLVYLYQPARRPGLSAKFFCPWTGPHQVTAKISTLNYEIQDRKAKKQTVHINRLKAAHYSSLWKPINEGNPARKRSRKPPVKIDSEEEVEILPRPIPLAQEVPTGLRRSIAQPLLYLNPHHKSWKPLVRKDPILLISRPLHQVPEGICTRRDSNPRL